MVRRSYQLTEGQSASSRRLRATASHAERQLQPRDRLLRRATLPSRLYQFNASRMILASPQKHPAAIATRPQRKVKEFEDGTLFDSFPRHSLPDRSDICSHPCENSYSIDLR